MPNTSLSEAIQEAFASAPSRPTLDTLEISHPASTTVRDKIDMVVMLDRFLGESTSMFYTDIDLCVVLDGTSGNTSGVATMLTDFANELESKYSGGTVRYSLAKYQAASNTIITGSTFVTRSTYNSAISSVSFTSESPSTTEGFLAVKNCATTLNWRTGATVMRIIVVFANDCFVNTNGATYADALNALRSNNVSVSQYSSMINSDWDTLCYATGGTSSIDWLFDGSPYDVVNNDFQQIFNYGTLNPLKAQILATIATLVAAFPDARFALSLPDIYIDYPDHPPYTVSGPKFVDYDTFVDLLNGVLPVLKTSSNKVQGFEAAQEAAETLDWRLQNSCVRMFLYAGITAHAPETGTINEAALAPSLTLRNIYFNAYIGYDTGYSSLISDTGGYSWNVATSGYLTPFIDAVTPLSSSPLTTLYLVRDRQDWTLTLEDSTTHLFTGCGFRFQLPEAGADGLQELALAVDNTDKTIGEFIKAVKKYRQPVRVTWRVYNVDDLTTPQNNPPLVFFIRDSETTLMEVTSNAAFADIINKKFPSELYTTVNFPTLK